MFSLPVVFLLGLAGPMVESTNTAGDPTNLSNWPSCAQQCIPIGLGPPTSCQSLSNLTCICDNPAFTVSIAGCEQSTCSTEELEQIQMLSEPLCAPDGGLASNVTSAAVSYLATAMLTASGVPTSLPADATAVSAVSAIIASASPEPNRRSPFNISNYPVCAQTCAEIVGSNFTTCDLTNIACLCGASYRSMSAACEELTCSPGDRLTISLLAQEVCGSLYSINSALGSSVTSAIASATASAVAAVASKDPTSISSYPECAQACQNKYLPGSGCSGLSDRECVCQTSTYFLSNIAPCERSTCSASDAEILEDLSYELCAPVGGIRNVSTAGNASNSTQPGISPTQAAEPFTGDATAMAMNLLPWSMIIATALIMGLVLR